MENKALGKGLSALITKNHSEAVPIKEPSSLELIHLEMLHMLKQFPFWGIDFSLGRIMMKLN